MSGCTTHYGQCQPIRFIEVAWRDKGKAYLERFGHKYLVASDFGVMAASDVGKRMYRVDGIWQMENNQQYTERIRA